MSGSNAADRVCILMGIYNGAEHLGAQLQSFAEQTQDRWDLIVGDDGSRDAGPDMVRDFAARMAPLGSKVTLVDGPCAGFVANFLALIAEAPATDWLALSDQDDVWLPDRLARGIAALTPLPRDTPALYCSRTWVTDSDLGNRRLSPDYAKPPGFANALLQNIAGGNTILLNRAAADLAREAAPAAAEVSELPAHDWWLYQLITGVGGTVVRDVAPTLLYRQHGGNQIGENTSWQAWKMRIAMVRSGRFQRWIDANIAALRLVRARLTPENRALLDRLEALRSLPLIPRIRAFAGLGLYRQGRIGQAALWLAVFWGKL